MYQSHASYSACGLGSAATDRLVELVRGDTAGTLSDLARDIGVTKGAASKIAKRLRKKAK